MGTITAPLAIRKFMWLAGAGPLPPETLSIQPGEGMRITFSRRPAASVMAESRRAASS